MARLVSKFLDFVGLEEADNDARDARYDRGEQQSYYEDYGRTERPAYDRDRYDERARYDEREERAPRGRAAERDYERDDRYRKKGGGKVVNHPAAVDATQHHMRIYQMEGYDDARAVIDDLLEKRSVLINLELVDVDVSQRIVDMLSGATYALSASLKKAAANTYLLAPDTVDVSGSYEEEERRRGGSFFGGGRR